MKIYYQYSSCQELTPTKGDFINELNNMKALSCFADVYYAGKLFNPYTCTFDSCRTLKIDKADFVWVRANEKVFFNAKSLNKPCCWMASPYNKKAFSEASFIAAFSDTWAFNLKYGFKNALNPEGLQWKNAENVSQALDDEFISSNDIYTQLIRRKIGGNFIIGCFGRIVKSNHPALLLSCIPDLINKYPGIRFVFGCTNKDKVNINHPSVIFSNYDHADMPYVLAACNATFTGAKGQEWDFCGSLKLIESAACGVPFICAESRARMELTGIGYPYFLKMDRFSDPEDPENKNALINVIDRMIKKDNERRSWGDYIMQKARKNYCISAQSKRLENIIHKYL